MCERAVRSRPRSLLVAIGVIGVTIPLLYFPREQPTSDPSDAIRGLWLGACLGLEILGMILLHKATAKRSG